MRYSEGQRVEVRQSNGEWWPAIVIAHSKRIIEVAYLPASPSRERIAQRGSGMALPAEIRLSAADAFTQEV